MSRFGDYGGGGERWNMERFNRERDGRQVIERERIEEHERYVPPRAPVEEFHSPPPRVAHGERFSERDRLFEEERFGPPARRPAGRQQRYYEEEDIDIFDGSPNRGPEPFGRRDYETKRAPPRPGIIRRQSSLDTFDRKPLPRYPREPPEIIPMPGPGRRRRSPPRYERDFEDIRIAEPDYYGDEEFRGYKEREVSTVRRRRGGAEPEFEEKFEERESFEVEEEPFPRKGKTRMPGRLVNKRAIIELGYPFEEEGEMVIILKALDKVRIDEVINLSKEMNRATSRTTYMIEAPPPPLEEVIERREIVIPEIVTQASPSEVPRSVREWDVMGGSIPGGHSEHGGGHSEHGAKSIHGGKSTHGGKSSHGGKSTHGGKSHHGGGKSTHGGHSIKSKHSVKGGHSTKGGESESESSSSSSSTSVPSVIIEKRSVRSKSHHRSKSVGHGEVIEEIGESNAMHNGPLALVLPHREKERSNSRDERSIKAEIRALEAEKKKLKMERELEKEHRKASKYDEVIVERRDKDVLVERRDRDVKIEKDRKGPDSRVVKAMLATLT